MSYQSTSSSSFSSFLSFSSPLFSPSSEALTATENSSAKTLSNPIYNLVADLLNKQTNSGKSLRLLASERWKSMSESEMIVYEHLSYSKYHETLLQTFTIDTTENLTSALPIIIMVASSHVYVDTWLEFDQPAEIGLVKISLQKNAVIDSWNHLFSNISSSSLSSLSPKLSQENITKISSEKSIKPEELHEHIKLLDSLCTMNIIIHNNDNNHYQDNHNNRLQQCNKKSLIFINDDEFTRTKAALNWCKDMSAKLGLTLQWNYSCIPLSVFYRFLSTLSSSEYSSEQPILTTTLLLNTNYNQHDYQVPQHQQLICSFHEQIESKGCSLSVAHFWAQILLDKFSPPSSSSPLMLANQKSEINVKKNNNKHGSFHPLPSYFDP